MLFEVFLEMALDGKEESPPWDRPDVVIAVFST